MCDAFVCHSQLVPQASRDLPCTGRPIRLVLTVRKFFCRNPACSRKVFAERLPDFIEVSSRLTKRLRTSVQDIGFATCGKGGESLGNKLGMPISDASVLWSLFLVPLPAGGQVRVVGVDDWSWRRGKRFGSILVNLETHKIIDLLADREAESVKQWLAAHPEVDVVSRDRGVVYIDGATWGAPQATQVADRWHILSNLGDAVEAFLIRAQFAWNMWQKCRGSARSQTNLSHLFLPPLAANGSHKHVCYANGNCISGYRNSTQLG